MIPRQFEYHAPETVPEAIALLQKYGDTAKLLAGGHSLLPMMKIRFAEPEHLVDLGKVAGLTGIRAEVLLQELLVLAIFFELFANCLM